MAYFVAYEFQEFLLIRYCSQVYIDGIVSRISSSVSYGFVEFYDIYCIPYFLLSIQIIIYMIGYFEDVTQV